MIRALTTFSTALALARVLAPQTGEPQGGSGWIMALAITLGLSAVAVLIFVVTRREP